MAEDVPFGHFLPGRASHLSLPRPGERFGYFGFLFYGGKPSEFSFTL